MRRIVILFATLVISIATYADTLNRITHAEASSGLKQALEQGVTNAISQLGRTSLRNVFWTLQ
ncbi:MAG: hypothetical protein ACYCSS_07075 [Sulfuriferula sp.]